MIQIIINIIFGLVAVVIGAGVVKEIFKVPIIGVPGKSKRLEITKNMLAEGFD